MKKMLLPAFAAILAVCFTISAPSASQTTPETAGILSSEGNANGNMGDQDWWKVTTTQYGSLMIETESDETLFIYIYLYDKDKRLLDKSEFMSSKTQNVGHISLAPGEYYVKAVPKSQSSGAYTISSTFTASLYVNENDSDHEPNNLEQQAYPVTHEILYTGHLGYYDRGNYDRTDYYWYSILGSRSVYIKIVGEPSLDIDVVFVDACGCSGGEREIPLETLYDYVWHFTYTNNCYLKISSKSDGYGSYALIITDAANRYFPPDIFTSSISDPLVGHDYEQRINTVDLDMGDVLSYNLLSAPHWLHIDENGILNGTPTFGDRGTSIPVVIQAVDSYLKADTLATTFNVKFEVDPPQNFTVSDMPNDHGYRIALAWDLSAVDNYLMHYAVYRSQFYEFNDPLPIESFDTLVDLIQAEQSHAILIDSVEPGTKTFIDPFVPQNNKGYYYWISAVSKYGESEKIAARYVPGITHVDNSPASFTVHPPFPNPFNPSTTISYEIAAGGRVSLVVYDILGRKAAVLQDGYTSAGIHEAVWDGRDSYGNVLGNGIYLYKINAGGHHAQGKVVLLR